MTSLYTKLKSKRNWVIFSKSISCLASRTRHERPRHNESVYMEAWQVSSLQVYQSVLEEKLNLESLTDVRGNDRRTDNGRCVWAFGSGALKLEKTFSNYKIAQGSNIRPIRTSCYKCFSVHIFHDCLYICREELQKVRSIEERHQGDDTEDGAGPSKVKEAEAPLQTKRKREDMMQKSPDLSSEDEVPANKEVPKAKKKKSSLINLIRDNHLKYNTFITKKVPKLLKSLGVDSTSESDN